MIPKVWLDEAVYLDAPEGSDALVEFIRLHIDPVQVTEDALRMVFAHPRRSGKTEALRQAREDIVFGPPWDRPDADPVADIRAFFRLAEHQYDTSGYMGSRFVPWTEPPGVDGMGSERDLIERINSRLRREARSWLSPTTSTWQAGRRPCRANTSADPGTA